MKGKISSDFLLNCREGEDKEVEFVEEKKVSKPENLLKDPEFANLKKDPEPANLNKDPVAPPITFWRLVS